MTDLTLWLRSFIPAPLTVSRREILLSCLGALLGLLCAEWLSHLLLGEFNPWFIAPMGASAVLLFAVPSSPLAQPWSIIGGNLVASLIGVTCALLLPHDLGAAAAIAVALAIGLMFILRCLHPPSGAVAITSVMGGPAVTSLGYHFVLTPVLVNSLFLLLIALIFNNLRRHRYPHRASVPKTQDPAPSERLGFTRGDLDQAIASYGELLDVSRDDLAEIIRGAKVHAFQRKSGDVRCHEIMSRDIVSVQHATPLTEALDILRVQQWLALPVLNEDRKVLGMLSIQDFLVPRRDTTHIINPLEDQWAKTVVDIMTHHAPTVDGDQPIGDLVGLFSDLNMHYVLVVDRDERIQGIITQSDLVAALFEIRLGEGRQG